MSNELAVKENQAMVSFIERAAADSNVDIDKLQKLIELKNSEEARTAKSQYNSAMAACQSEMPEIQENGAAHNNIKYAKYEDIVKAVKPLLAKHGFSFSAKTNFDEKFLVAQGIVSHAGGHSEETSIRLPFDNSGSKNAVQAIGSSISYAKRYLFCMLFNITTGGEDDDGNTASGTITPDQAEKLKTRLKTTGSDVKAFLTILRSDSVDALPAEFYAKADSMLTKKERDLSNADN